MAIEPAPAHEAPRPVNVDDADLEYEAPAQSLREYLPSLPQLRLRPTLRYREWLLLALILLAGAFFRFTGVNWDNGHHLHPDERFLTMVEGAIKPGLVVPAAKDAPVQVQPASLLASYFDTARSGLNPHNVGFGFFVYGTFPLFAVRWLAEIVNATGYDKVHLLGRALSGLSDLVTVALIYLIGRRLYGARVGLLAAALVAFCVMHIQQAHFFVFDSFLVTLITACFYSCVDIAETGRWRSFVLAGVFLGLALATKLSMLVFAPIVALAGLIYLWRASSGFRVSSFGLDPANGPDGTHGPDGAEGATRASPVAGGGIGFIAHLWDSGLLSRVIGGGALTLLVALLMFRVFQPYAFAGPGFFGLQLNPRWLDNIAYQAKTQSGEVDLPPSIQWAGTEPLLFPWRHMVAWGMGIPLGLTSWAGFAAAAAVVLWRGRWQHLLVLSWSGLCFVYFASVLNKTMRYLLPAYPFFILLGAWGLVALYQWTRRDLTPSPFPTREGERQGNSDGQWPSLVTAEGGPE
ncbi:MAG: ArnT family glycosyltransferase, partial [Chloroflexota bacterium]